MDGDPAEEPLLDSFGLVLPLPFRVATIVVLGVWAWGANLQYLAQCKIDVPTLIKYPPRASSTQPAHHLSTYRLAALLSLALTACLLIFWTLTRGSPDLVIAYDWLPMTFLLAIAVFFVAPLRQPCRAGRLRFLAILKRVSIGGIALPNDGKFGDILLADVLTSYAKVLGDLFVSLCMFLSAGGSATALPDRNCGGQFIVPLLIAVPSLIRLRQCLIEYARVRDNPTPSTGWGGQHLANATKYASALPVIILSALQRSLSFDEASVGLGAPAVYRLWLLAVLFNSLYSFYWDVAKDWDLTLLSDTRARNAPGQAWGLRRALGFRDTRAYYAVIVLDLIFRCTWSLKLSPHLDHFNDLEGGIFILEILEVFRRWVWIFFRVETEALRAVASHDSTDLLLGDYAHDDDDV